MRGGVAALLLCALLWASPAAARANVVFLLPQPGHGDAQFFAAAQRYYAAQPEIDAVVDSVSTLLQVREWLQHSDLRGDAPWGRIVLVAHGSRWTGLALPIFDDEGVAPPGRWREVASRGEFLPLAPGVIDAHTELWIESCGLGTRRDLLAYLGQMLAGDLALTPHAAHGLVAFGESDGQVWRRELDYGARIRPRRGAPIAPEGMRALPIEFRLAFASSVPCAEVDRRSLLRPGTPMRQTLSDHGLAPRDLSFELLAQGQGCVLRGRGSLLISAQSAWTLPAVIGAEVP